VGAGGAARGGGWGRARTVRVPCSGGRRAGPGRPRPAALDPERTDRVVVGDRLDVAEVDAEPQEGVGHAGDGAVGHPGARVGVVPGQLAELGVSGAGVACGRGAGGAGGRRARQSAARAVLRFASAPSAPVCPPLTLDAKQAGVVGDRRGGWGFVWGVRTLERVPGVGARLRGAGAGAAAALRCTPPPTTCRRTCRRARGERAGQRQRGCRQHQRPGGNRHAARRR
jgi:hypothetical protein